MNDEELLKAVGRSARSAQPLDERWDKLAAEALSEEERAQLLEQAAQSEEAAEAYEAFRPLGAEFEARVVHRLLGEQARTAPSSPATSAPGKVVEFPRRKPRFAWVSLALAASLLLAVGVVTLMQPGAVPSLPGYGLRLEGQVTLMRGQSPPAQAAPFAPGNHFRLVLTPDQRVEGDVVARAYVLAGDKPVPFAAPAPRISADGAVLIEGEVGRDVQIPAGDARLLVVVGRASKLPEPGALAAQLGASGQEQGSDWAAWMLPIRGE
jgi:hypothetical protein